MLSLRNSTNIFKKYSFKSPKYWKLGLLKEYTEEGFKNLKK